MLDDCTLCKSAAVPLLVSTSKFTSAAARREAHEGVPLIISGAAAGTGGCKAVKARKATS